MNFEVLAQWAPPGCTDIDTSPELYLPPIKKVAKVHFEGNRIRPGREQDGYQNNMNGSQLAPA